MRPDPDTADTRPPPDRPVRDWRSTLLCVLLFILGFVTARLY
jgi:hypothetical protein